MDEILRVLMPGFEGTTLPAWLEARLREGLGGVCIFGPNITSREQLRTLTAAIRAANPDALIAIDEEGGDVTRLYYDQGSPYPGNALLGRIDDRNYTGLVATAVGLELRDAGINLNFAPDVDINSNPDNPVIGVRSFGADPERVAAHSQAWIAAHEATGVAVAAKHFPGHGDTAQDSHLALPVVDRSLDELRERELVPFVAAIGAGARSIMSSHIMLPQLDPKYPATFSKIILEKLLRDDLGFDGVIVSDALDMVGASGERGIPQAAVQALVAGCDLLCIGTNTTDELLAAIISDIDIAGWEGRLLEERLYEAGERCVTLARELATDFPVVAVPVLDFPLERSYAGFDVRPGLTVEADRTLVAIDTAANIAVGVAPWGPAVAARIAEGDALPETRGQLVLVGKDNHRHAWVRSLIDEARRAHPGVIIIDMGWPGDDRAYADVATFGASRHVGEALVAWLERETP